MCSDAIILPAATLILVVVIFLMNMRSRSKNLDLEYGAKEYDAKYLILKKEAENSIVGPEPTREELYQQIDYLCDAHRKVSVENAALRAEIIILRGL